VPGNPVPLFGVFGGGAVEDAASGGFVGFVGANPAVVNRELLKVTQDAKRELGAPRIAAELIGRAGLVLDGDGRFLGFKKEFACAAYPKAVNREP